MSTLVIGRPRARHCTCVREFCCALPLSLSLCIYICVCVSVACRPTCVVVCTSEQNSLADTRLVLRTPSTISARADSAGRDSSARCISVCVCVCTVIDYSAVAERHYTNEVYNSISAAIVTARAALTVRASMRGGDSVR